VRRGSILLLLVVALVSVAGALAAPIAKSPSSMILRKSDFPAGADYDSSSSDDIGVADAIDAAGIDVDSASYLGATFSKKKGFLQVSGTVMTLKSAAQAKRAFALAKAARDALLKKLGGAGKKVTVPSFGDQQFVHYDAPGAEGIAITELLVRRGSVVWLMHLSLERQPRPSGSEVLGDLGKYATKQKTRVGAG
jgi:hypothetical protein